MNFLFYLESIRTPFLTEFFSFITRFGEETVLLALVCFLYWCVNKKLAYSMCFSYFVSGIGIQLLKITFRIPRPWILDPNFQPIDNALKAATGYSFPSGHTQGATTMFSSLSFYCKKTYITILSFLMIFLVGFSRMYLGVHTPKDVLCSFFFTLFLTIVITYLNERIMITKQNSLWIAIILFLISLASIFYSFFLLKNGIISMENASDSIKAGGAGIGFAIGFYFERNYIDFSEQGLPFKSQLMKFLLGAIITVALKAGLKPLLGTKFPMDAIRYMILVLWITVIYPFFIKQYTKKTNKL